MKKKVLLMGKSGSGKTSMRSIIFANYVAKDTKRLGATIDVEHSHVRFLGNLVLNLWDCGGQEAFMENYFVSQRENIFRNVEVLIYVFDVESRDEELKKDLRYYQTCLSAIYENSPSAQVFCLIHKMDLLPEDQREKLFTERQNEIINMSKPVKCTCFKTSIWDETLYGAWSSIVYKLIPNVQELEQSLKMFADLMECDEVLLFERSTFLIISFCELATHRDARRFEKVSNIIKGFKLSCSKLAAQFTAMEVRNKNFAVFMDVFTPNTYIMVVMSDPNIPSAAVSLNIKNARKHFEKLERTNQIHETSAAASTTSAAASTTSTAASMTGVTASTTSVAASTTSVAFSMTSVAASMASVAAGMTSADAGTTSVDAGMTSVAASTTSVTASTTSAAASTTNAATNTS